jgi:phage terminase large subunit
MKEIGEYEELIAPLTPKQIELDLAINKHNIILFGGARGGGKSHGMRTIMLARRFEYPGSIGYIFRKTYPELEANHISPLFEQFPSLKKYYLDSKKTLRLPNGSQLRFAHCEAKKDLYKYQGREIHDLAIEEAGDWPFEHYEYLRTCNRSSLATVPAKCILTANPGGLGHKWLKRLFVDKRYEEGENPKDYHFIPSRVEDNPALINADPMYVKRLESIKSKMLRRAFRYGDWNIQAGQFFDFRHNVHVIEPFEIPSHWNRFGSYDYGFNHPAAWLKWAIDEDGCVYVYWEHVEANESLSKQAQNVLNPKEKIQVYWAGHDCFATKKAGDPTIAEDFSKFKIFMKPANISRVLGASRIRNYLEYKDTEQGRIGPRVKIFKDCEILIDCLTRMVHDEKNIEDVLKVDSVDGDPTTGDDAYDAFRYGIMSRPAITQKPEEPDKKRYRPKKSKHTHGPWTT